MSYKYPHLLSFSFLWCEKTCFAWFCPTMLLDRRVSCSYNPVTLIIFPYHDEHFFDFRFIFHVLINIYKRQNDDEIMHVFFLQSSIYHNEIKRKKMPNPTWHLQIRVGTMWFKNTSIFTLLFDHNHVSYDMNFPAHLENIFRILNNNEVKLRYMLFIILRTITKFVDV